MGLVDDKQRWIANVALLRRAERSSPAGEEIAAVRTDLERAVGRTVSRALAARLLGVSQTALSRWIDSRDVPVVMTPNGRREVPLHTLMELMEAVEERRRTSYDRHPLASVLRQRRDRAEALDMGKILPARYRRDRPHGHRGPELRSLAYHRAVAQRLDPQIVGDARDRLRRWRSEGKLHPRYAEQWERLLSRPLPHIARLIGSDTQRTRDLRQNSPFAGTLSEPERQRVLETLR
jgi:hypothetical protein